MNFASDNVYGVHPRLLETLHEVNAGAASSYGADDWTQRAEARLAEVFECDLKAFLVVTGTAANALALSAMTPPYGAIVCHGEAHIMNDEGGAPELFTGGAKLVGLAGAGGKISAQAVEAKLDSFVRGEIRPAAVSITQASEFGTVYTPDEIRAIAAVAQRRNMGLHMDGARFANAVVSLGTMPAEATWKAGVDALSFGATKNGAMALEAVVFFKAELAEDFAFRRKRAGQLLSKSRFLGAQMLAYLDGDLWLDNARHANAMAQRLAKGMAASGKVRLAAPTEANEVFPVMARSLDAALRKAGVVYHPWPGGAPGSPPLANDEVLARFVTSFQTRTEDVDRVVELLG